jgi:hypothetical protein
VQSIGDRRGRVPVSQVAALEQLFAQTKFLAMKNPDSSGECPDKPQLTITYYPDQGDSNSITDDHCPGSPELDDLEAKVITYLDADLWIHTNPGGTMPDGDHLLFSFDETACFGQCPVYSFLVFDDGTLLWHGDSNVSVTGDKRVTLPPDHVQALIDAFAAAGWLPPPEPDAGPGGATVEKLATMCTDTPHTIITYQRGGRHETQDNAHCDGDWDFDDHVLAIAGVDTFVHTPIEILHYEQTMCLGKCPSYVVSVNDVGDVTWEGDKYVDATGDRTAKLDSKQLEALEDAFAQAKFFDLPEKTDRSCTDHPETKITFTNDKQTHSVIDFHCKENGSALGDLEKTVHGLLSLDAWIHEH